MNELQKEFEKTGYNSWINSDIYPDGKIYTKEYTEWLEKRLVKLLDLPHVMQQSEQLHIAQLIMVIEEFIEPLHPIRHSNSFLKLKAMCNCA